MTDRLASTIIANTINELCQAAHDNAKAKGFHEHYRIVSDFELWSSIADRLVNQFDQACMARIMGEVGEAVEAMRHGNPESEKIPGFSHVEEELADTLIRIFDYCGMKNYDLGGAILAKMAHNEGRPFLHGKNS